MSQFLTNKGHPLLIKYLKMLHTFIKNGLDLKTLICLKVESFVAYPRVDLGGKSLREVEGVGY